MANADVNGTENIRRKVPPSPLQGDIPVRRKRRGFLHSRNPANRRGSETRLPTSDGTVLASVGSAPSCWHGHSHRPTYHCRLGSQDGSHLGRHLAGNQSKCSASADTVTDRIISTNESTVANASASHARPSAYGLKAGILSLIKNRSNGWLAQPSVHLFDRSEGGFIPREQVVDRKPYYPNGGRDFTSFTAWRCHSIWLYVRGSGEGSSGTPSPGCSDRKENSPLVSTESPVVHGFSGSSRGSRAVDMNS